MRMRSGVAVVCVVAMLVVGPAWATMKDSVEFTNQYNGNVLPDAAGFTYSGTLASSEYNSTNGSVMTLDTASVAGGQTSYWYQMPGAASPALGYTVEARFQVLSSVNSGSDVNRGFWLSTKAGGSGVILSFFNDSIMHRAGGDEIIYTADNSDAFHTYRITIAAGGATFDLYRDNQLVVANRNVGIAWEEIGFGDPTGNPVSPDLNVALDYVRWDTTGAYAPVPEPMTMSILGLGCMALIRRK